MTGHISRIDVAETILETIVAERIQRRRAVN